MAPGSWWPRERSPRRSARPRRATRGVVACIPSRAARMAPTTAASWPAPDASAARERVGGGAQGVVDRLVAEAAAAAPGDALGRRVEGARRVLRAQRVEPRDRDPGLDEGGAVERPAGPADAGHEQVAHPPQEVADVRSASTRPEGPDGVAEPDAHVLAVVAVAQLGVEAVQQGPVAQQEALGPGDDRGEVGPVKATGARAGRPRPRPGPARGGPEDGGGGSSPLRMLMGERSVWRTPHPGPGRRASTDPAGRPGMRERAVVGLVLVAHSEEVVRGVAAMVAQAAPACPWPVPGASAAGGSGPTASRSRRPPGGPRRDRRRRDPRPARPRQRRDGGRRRDRRAGPRGQRDSCAYRGTPRSSRGPCWRA